MRILILSTLILSACATPQSVMSSRTGCPADELKVLETEPGLGTDQTTWRAACGNKEYKCQAGPYAGSSDWLKEMTCGPAPVANPDRAYLGKDDLREEKKRSEKTGTDTTVR